MDRSPERADRVLATGDLLAVTAVIAWGIVSHQGLAGLASPLTVAEIVFPFLLGYAVVALLVDAYRRRSLASPAWSVRLGAAAWLGGANVGLILRGSPYLDGGVAWPFPLVVTGAGLVAVVAWRAAFAAVVGK